MSEFANWELRLRGTDNVATATADKLAEFIQAGVIGEQHEVRVVGATEWLSVAQATPFLPISRPATPPSNDPPSNVPQSNVPPNDPESPVTKPASKQTPKSTLSSTGQTPTRKAAKRPVPPPPPPAAKTKPLVAQPSIDRRGMAPKPLAGKPSARPEVPPPKPVKQPATSRWLTDTDASSSAKSSIPESVGDAMATLPPSRGERPAARRGPLGDPDDDELDMTPMIDMTFLLLIFFMVTSTISPFADLQLPEAKAGDAERPEGRVILVLDYQAPVADSSRYTGSEFIEFKDCKLYLADETNSFIPPDQLHAALVRAFEKNGGGEFILQSNRKMPVGVVREVIKTAKSAGAGDTMIGVARPR